LNYFVNKEFIKGIFNKEKSRLYTILILEFLREILRMRENLKNEIEKKDVKIMNWQERMEMI